MSNEILGAMIQIYSPSTTLPIQTGTRLLNWPERVGFISLDQWLLMPPPRNLLCALLQDLVDAKSDVDSLRSASPALIESDSEEYLSPGEDPEELAALQKYVFEETYEELSGEPSPSRAQGQSL